MTGDVRSDQNAEGVEVELVLGGVEAQGSQVHQAWGRQGELEIVAKRVGGGEPGGTVPVAVCTDVPRPK